MTLFTGTPDPDHLVGTDGDDTFVGLAGADVFDGLGGSDTADYTKSSAAVQVITDGTNLGGDAQGDVFHSIENVTGSKFNDFIFGDGANNHFSGGDGNDELYGNDGNDVLTGGYGADFLHGGNGFDTADYSTAPGLVRLDLEGDIEGFGGDAFGDNLLSIEHIVGSNFADSIGIGSLAGFVLDAGGGDDFIAAKANTQTINGQDGNDRIDGGAGADILDGGKGIDTLDYTHSSVPVAVNLGAKTVSGGDATGDTISNFENVYGTGGRDMLVGDAGANELAGFSGDDRLIGLSGRDTLTGGLGADRYVYSSVTDSGVGVTQRDLVQGFSRGELDKIELSAIDAKDGDANNDAFTFIGTGQFTAAGQVRFTVDGTHTIIEANTSGTSGAEMQIEMNSLVNFQSNDFVL